ncbi:glycosyltransferase [Roseospirillum parvum]|uniref:Glycosyltransferase involved in cell wall bisynthesis n=1 Tax=Roseospirillum parvum TaxID=83401 RepID=A0A1G8BUV2_9PROT|nr:glycosyltransferase [Roseospirillum parvum]SDH36849.1 Glycosyltransferase involved in cell wall bisynthesis [Roseospirillum parvum]
MSSLSEITARRPVVVVLPSLAGGGAERVALGLLAEATRAGLAARLITLGGPHTLADLVPSGVAWRDLGRPRLRQALPGLIGELRRCGPATVFSTFGHLNLPLLAARPVLPRGTRLVIREANLPSLSLHRVPVPGLFGRLMGLLYPTADCVVASSRLMADELQARFRVPPGRLEVCPNPTDVRTLRAAATPPRRAPGPGLRLVAAGRLTRQKGVDRLIPLLGELPADTHLTVLGEGPEGPAWRALAERLGVQARIEWRGFAACPWPWLAGADALVLPSRWEGLPNVVLEALACGTPVVAAPEAGAVAEIAEAALGAVRLATPGPAMVAALAALDRKTADAVRPSLLPAMYTAPAAGRRFLAAVVGGDSTPRAR